MKTITRDECFEQIWNSNKPFNCNDTCKDFKHCLGLRLIDVLQLRRAKGWQDRYQTAWGAKTPTGIFNVANRIMNLNQ